MAGKSPLQRSKAMMEADGWLWWTTEHWCPFARVRKDLWTFADALLLKDKEIIALQVTSRGNVSARAKKIAEAPTVDAVRKAGIRILIHGWGLMASGKWECKVVDVS